MALNIRNRSLLSLVHHTDRDLLYLLDLVPGSQAREVLRPRTGRAWRARTSR